MDWHEPSHALLGFGTSNRFGLPSLVLERGCASSEDCDHSFANHLLELAPILTRRSAGPGAIGIDVEEDEVTLREFVRDEAEEPDPFGSSLVLPSVRADGGARSFVVWKWAQFQLARVERRNEQSRSISNQLADDWDSLLPGVLTQNQNRRRHSPEALRDQNV
ncbi:MAG: hypothetical protein QM817_26500 [Archangium sp.]